MCSADFFLAFLAVLFPPLAVWVKRGICSVDSIINLALCCLGYLPGLLHAWYIISKYPEQPSYQPIESEAYPRVYYFGPQCGAQPNAPSPGPGSQSHSPAPPQGYGAVQQQSPQPPTPHTPSIYTNYQQQTHDQGQAGPSNGVNNGQGGSPPSYAEVVKGDFKVQTQD